MNTKRFAPVLVGRLLLTRALAALVGLALACPSAEAIELDARTRQLFAWFDGLEVFPQQRTLICTVYRPDPKSSYVDARPQIGVVASEGKDWLFCWTLTLFQQQRQLADRRPDVSIDDFDISQLPKHVWGNTPFREVTVPEACGVFLNYYRSLGRWMTSGSQVSPQPICGALSWRGSPSLTGTPNWPKKFSVSRHVVAEPRS